MRRSYWGDSEVRLQSHVERDRGKYAMASRVWLGEEGFPVHAVDICESAKGGCGASIRLVSKRCCQSVCIRRVNQ